MKLEVKYLADFIDEVLVCCPRCKACSRLSMQRTSAVGRVDYRLTCTSCGHSEHCNVAVVPSVRTIDSLIDAQIGGHDLWLQIPCCGHRLWALNRSHLNYLADVVAAEIRESTRNAEVGHQSGQLACRLPKWMIAKSNRAKVLSSIEKLRSKGVA